MDLLDHLIVPPGLRAHESYNDRQLFGVRQTGHNEQSQVPGEQFRQTSVTSTSPVHTQGDIEVLLQVISNERRFAGYLIKNAPSDMPADEFILQSYEEFFGEIEQNDLSGRDTSGGAEPTAANHSPSHQNAISVFNEFCQKASHPVPTYTFTVRSDNKFLAKMQSGNLTLVSSEAAVSHQAAKKIVCQQALDLLGLSRPLTNTKVNKALRTLSNICTPQFGPVAPNSTPAAGQTATNPIDLTSTTDQFSYTVPNPGPPPPASPRSPHPNPPTQQAHDLALSLGFPPPIYKYQLTPESARYNAPYWTVTAHMASIYQPHAADGMRTPTGSEIARVEGIHGKEVARRECARLVVGWLEGVREQRGREVGGLWEGEG